MKFTKVRVSIVIFILIPILIVGYLSTVHYKSRVVLGGKVFSVDVADTYFTLKKGLSERKSISKNEGMLFVFEKKDKQSFWMKDMFFSIDIIWVDENYVITHIEKSVSPDTYPKVFSPEAPSLYVLEVSAGQADLLGIKVGDTVSFSK